MANKLSDQQKRFCHEYLIDFNATKAAERAKYSKKTAYSQGQRLLKNVEIQSYLSKLKKKTEERLEIKKNDIIRELQKIGFSNIENYIDIEEGGLIIAKQFKDMPEGASAALQTVEENRIIKENKDGSQVVVHDKIKFRVHDKLKALQLLGEHVDLFKSEKEIPLNINFRFEYGSNGDTNNSEE